VDSSQAKVLQAIGDCRTEPGSAEVLKALAEAKDRAEAAHAQVLKAVGAGRGPEEAARFAQALQELQQLQPALLAAVRESRSEVNFSPVVLEIRQVQSQAAADHAALLAALEGLRKADAPEPGWAAGLRAKVEEALRRHEELRASH